MNTFQAIVAHGMGGFLCFASAYGFSSHLPAGVASALARHGLLLEMGWEAQDLVWRIYTSMHGPPLFRQLNPPGIIVAFILHHTAAFCMVIPLNLYYPDFVEAHEISFLLQGAYFLALLLQHYGCTLDVTTSKGLKQMKISTLIVFFIFAWSRLVRYFWLAWIIGERLWSDGNMTIFKLFCIPLVCLSFINVFFLLDALDKLITFLPIKLSEEDAETIKDLATDAASAGIMSRQMSSCFGMNKSQKEWAKVKGAVWMGVFCSHAHGTKAKELKKDE